MGSRLLHGPLAVTGLGAVSPLGGSASDLWAGLFSRSGHFVAPLHFDAGSMSDRVVGIVPGQTLEALRAGDHTIRLGARAAREALNDSGVPDPGDVACVLGTTEIGNTDFVEACAADGDSPLQGSLDALPADMSVRLASEAGASLTRSLTIANASASGAMAVRVASDLVKSETCESSLAVGADSITEAAFAGLASLRLLSGSGCRSFNRDRSGIRVSEGAAALLLEPPAATRSRGSRPHALLLGCGGSSAVGSQVRLEAEGIAGAVASAMEEADCSSSDVGMIKTHSAGTVQGDPEEIRALRTVFGARLEQIPIASWKPVTGHCLGAAGAIEAVGAVLAVERGLIPPTWGLDAVDMEFAGLDLTPEPRPWCDGSRLALSISCGFGGTCVALLFANEGNPR